MPLSSIFSYKFKNLMRVNKMMVNIVNQKVQETRLALVRKYTFRELNFSQMMRSHHIERYRMNLRFR